MGFLWNEILYRPIFNALIFIYNVLPIQDVGLAIIILTLVIRFILLPLSWYSMKSQRMMQTLQPELNKLKEKYKGDQQGLAGATMKFYKEHGINPLSSCVPLLVQFPILIALYQVLRNGLNGDQFDLLYSFVARPEVFNETFLGLIDLTLPYWPLAIAVGIAQFFQGYLLRPPQKKKKPKDKSKKKDDGALFNTEDLSSMMSTQFTYIMPIMTVFIAWNLFAGLPLYWITTTIFSVFTQVAIRYRYPVKQVQATDQEYHPESNDKSDNKSDDKPDTQFNPDDYLLESSQEKGVNISVKKRQTPK